MPTVSVIMPTYNGERHLVPAVRSILAQTLTDLELIIVDDGSTDRTPDLLTSLDDSRLRVTRLARNSGIARATDCGYRLATGRYLAHMDHDDVALPQRLALQVACLEARPELAGCGGVAVPFKGRQDRLLRLLPESVGRKPPVEPDLVAASTLFGGRLFNPTLLFRREALALARRAGEPPEWHDPAFTVAGDDEFFERWMAAGARFAILGERVLLYRRHGGNTSRQAKDVTPGGGRATRDAVMAALTCRAAKRLVPDATPEELALHGRLALRAPDLVPEEAPAVRAWLARLMEGNACAQSGGRGFAPESLARELADAWLRACGVMACHHPWQGLAAFRSAPELSRAPAWTLLYQWQKRLPRYRRARAAARMV